MRVRHPGNPWSAFTDTSDETHRAFVAHARGAEPRAATPHESATKGAFRGDRRLCAHLDRSCETRSSRGSHVVILT